MSDKGQADPATMARTTGRIDVRHPAWPAISSASVHFQVEKRRTDEISIRARENSGRSRNVSFAALPASDGSTAGRLDERCGSVCAEARLSMGVMQFAPSSGEWPHQRGGCAHGRRSRQRRSEEGAHSDRADPRENLCDLRPHLVVRECPFLRCHLSLC